MELASTAAEALDGKTWMAQLWQAICGRAITGVVLPGSHDSATAALSRDVANDYGGAKILQLRRSRCRPAEAWEHGSTRA